MQIIYNNVKFKLQKKKELYILHRNIYIDYILIYVFSYLVLLFIILLKKI